MRLLHFVAALRPRRRLRLWWLSPTLAVSGAVAARDLRDLLRSDIRAVLDLQQETNDRTPVFAAHGLAYRKLAVRDFGAPTQEDLYATTGWILQQMAADRAVLLHCRAGVGRSAMFAIATLVRIGYPLPEAYALLNRARPEMALSEAQLAALRRFSVAEMQ